MLLSLCRSKAGARTTEPILLNFHKTYSLDQKRCTKSSFGQFKNPYSPKIIDWKKFTFFSNRLWALYMKIGVQRVHYHITKRSLTYKLYKSVQGLRLQTFESKGMILTSLPSKNTQFITLNRFKQSLYQKLHVSVLCTLTPKVEDFSPERGSEFKQLIFT